MTLTYKLEYATISLTCRAAAGSLPPTHPCPTPRARTHLQTRIREDKPDVQGSSWPPTGSKPKNSFLHAWNQDLHVERHTPGFRPTPTYGGRAEGRGAAWGGGFRVGVSSGCACLKPRPARREMLGFRPTPTYSRRSRGGGRGEEQVGVRFGVGTGCACLKPRPANRKACAPHQPAAGKAEGMAWVKERFGVRVGVGNCSNSFACLAPGPAGGEEHTRLAPKPQHTHAYLQ